MRIEGRARIEGRGGEGKGEEERCQMGHDR